MHVGPNEQISVFEAPLHWNYLKTQNKKNWMKHSDSIAHLLWNLFGPDWKKQLTVPHKEQWWKKTRVHWKTSMDADGKGTRWKSGDIDAAQQLPGCCSLWCVICRLAHTVSGLAARLRAEPGHGKSADRLRLRRGQRSGQRHRLQLGFSHQERVWNSIQVFVSFFFF